MAFREEWSHWLFRIGWVALVLGWVDPLEGSALILPGAGLVLLATFLSPEQRQLAVFRSWAFAALAVGVAALWTLSWYGGIGGSDGHSAWWAVAVVPYPVGWWMIVLGPGTPRWALWAGAAVGAWYFVLAGVVTWAGRQPVELESVATGIGIALIGAVTVTGCLLRLRGPAAA